MICTVALISVNTDLYGAERSLVALAKIIKVEPNCSPLLIIPRHGQIEKLLQEEKIDYLVHNFQGNVNYGRGLQLLRGVSKFIFNLVSVTALCLRFRLANIKVDLVHTNTLTTDYGLLLAKLTRVPHIWHFREAAKDAFNFDFELGFSFFSFLARRSEVVVCNSKYLADYYSRLLRREDIQIVHNGVSLPEMRYRRSEIRDSDSLAITLVARLTDEKEHILALQACSLLLESGRRNFSLDLWGDGPMLDRLATESEDLGLSSYIRFRGFANNLPYELYDIGITCCRFESFGRATVEYMLGGLAVVAVRAGATCEIVPSNCGLLSEPGNAKQMAENLTRLYDNRALVRKLGDSGKRFASLNFSEVSYGRSVLRLYDRAINKVD